MSEQRNVVYRTNGAMVLKTYEDHRGMPHTSLFSYQGVWKPISDCVGISKWTVIDAKAATEQMEYQLSVFQPDKVRTERLSVESLQTPPFHLPEDESVNKLTIRDYFAGQALRGLLAHRIEDSYGLWQTRVADQAYEIAREMMERREKKSE